jgi:hypothetical protein
MTKREANSWLVEAAGVVVFLAHWQDPRCHHHVSIAIETLKSSEGSRRLAAFYDVRAITVLRWAAKARHPQARSAWRYEARVLGFCAAVLRATVEEERGPDLAAENARLREKAAALRAGLCVLVMEFKDALIYVDDHFREKWGYDDTIKNAEALAAAMQENGEGGCS